MMEITSRQIVAGSLGKLKPKTEDKSQLPKGINLEESPKIKPLALNLCCGIWDDGWAQGLTKAGWDVINVGIEILGALPGFSIQADVREIAKDVQAYFPALKFDLVVASPPCQEFSYSSFPFRKAKEKFKNNPPDPTIWKACVEIARQLKTPLILENVSGARKWMGKNSWKYGSFYFWGVMPALLPIGNPRKGFKNNPIEKPNKKRNTEWRGNVQGKAGFPGECERPELTYKKMVGSEKYKIVGGSRQRLSPGSARKEWSAKAAMIPEELSTWIGECFYPQEMRGH